MLEEHQQLQEGEELLQNSDHPGIDYSVDFIYGSDQDQYMSGQSSDATTDSQDS